MQRSQLTVLLTKLIPFVSHIGFIESIVIDPMFAITGFYHVSFFSNDKETRGFHKTFA